jgi:hypothetical protein
MEKDGLFENVYDGICVVLARFYGVKLSNITDSVVFSPF